MTPRPNVVGGLALAVWLVVSPACEEDRDDDSAWGDDDVADDDAADDDALDADDASVASVDLPSHLACGAAVVASVTMTNSGSSTWSRDEGYKLGAVGDDDPFYTTDTRVWLPEGIAVAPGESHTFAFTLVAPAQPGTYATDWRMVHEAVRWFGEEVSQGVVVDCEPTAGRTGLVQLQGNSLIDDQGTFNALGATMMWAAWGYRNDRARLESNLAYLSSHGFHYIRALGVVGDPDEPDYWDGREIDEQWPDYGDVVAGLTDLVFDTYGMRVEWTLIGDGQITVPTLQERYDLIDSFLAMSQGREEKIIHFEIANEYWQNGFDGGDGLAQLRQLSAYMRDRTDILVAASAPAGQECSDVEAIYAGEVADLATIHFDRNNTMVEGAWRPVRQPWELEYCDDVPIGSNNEPIGPGSSVASEEDPVKLVAAAITTYVANLPLYVFHTSAGVRGDEDLFAMPGVDAFVHLADIVPGDLASWERQNAHWADSPFRVFAEDSSGTMHADSMWVDLGDPVSGAVRAYGDIQGDDFFVFPIGILGSVTMEPRRDMDFEAIDPMTGATIQSWSLQAGESFVLAGGEALVLRGRFR